MPQTFEANKEVARMGGEVAGIARRELEKRTGKPVITSKKAADLHPILTEIIEEAAKLTEPQEKQDTVGKKK